MNLIEDVLEQYVYEKYLRPATITSYRCAVRNASKFNITSMNQDNLNNLLEWRNEILKNNTASSWNNYLRHLRALGNFWKKKSNKKHNPFSKIGFVREPKKKKKTVNQENLFSLLNHINAHPDKFSPSWFWVCTYKMLYYTGIRRGELVRIKVSDIDVQKEIILISSEKNKTYKYREIPIPFQVITELKYLIEQVMKVKFDLSTQLFNITLFNRRYKGTELTVEALSGFFKRLKKSSGIQISPHMLRHSMATDILSNNGSVKVLQVLLGHSDIRTTLEYVHPNFTELKKNLDYLPVF